MIARRVVFGLLAAAIGCHDRNPPAHKAANKEAYSSYFKDFRSADDPSLSREDRTIVAAVRSRLERLGDKPIDALFRVKRLDPEYEVFVLHVAGYQNDQPHFLGHCTAIVDQNGRVVRILPGA